ncbi:MAG: hypothetical protein EBU33_06335 [Sphingobacteriia bacterium]|nr:hypothetical protein [Sphingobacteriia bacterium]
MADFQITAAEVLEVLYSDSNPNLIYGIKVKPLDGTPSEDETTLSVMTAKPLNTSILFWNPFPNWEWYFLIQLWQELTGFYWVLLVFLLRASLQLA